MVSLVGTWSSGCGETEPSSADGLASFVCGTDGKTYSVEDAGRDEHEVRHRGRCEAPMFCDSPSDCFVGDRCVASDPGRWCIPGPARCNCPGVFEPVCGRDGRNYINACEAACAGVWIAYDDYCDDPPGDGCVRAGCSDQLCVEEGVDVASTCEWRPVFECYQQAACERQDNGQCGFTPTHELVECLERHGEGMCRLDPRWNDGFEAECESPQVPGVTGVIAVTPHAGMRLGEWFPASYELLEPAVFEGQFMGEGVLVCEGERTRLQGAVEMTPLGPLEFECVVLPAAQPGECLDDSDCPSGHYCERFAVQAPDQTGSDIPELPPGICVDLCALVDCAPGYVCERGQCLPSDCRTMGCEDGWTCENCAVDDGSREWICLPPEAGACEPPDTCRPTGCNGEICADRDVASPCVALPELACYREVGICEKQPWGNCGWTPTPELDACLSEFDCRAAGCEDGDYCTYCWTEWACIPEGAVC